MKPKVFKTIIAALCSMAFLGLVGCSGVTPSESDASEGDEAWEGNWERSDTSYDDDDYTETHICSHACYVCGKCLDADCDNEVCADKCYDANGRTDYVFNATDDRVERSGGVTIEGTHVGNINQNASAVITYHITVEEETTVCLGATISEMNEDNYVTSDTPIYINGEQFYSRACLKAGSTTWTNFYTVWLGCVTLQKGDNEIKLTNNHSDGQQYNFQDFTFRSPAEISWTDELEECTHQNSEGKCTDYTSNAYACLDKDETGWSQLVIQGGDDMVLKYYETESGDASLWNSSEECIGNIANSLITGIYNQTIIWSFEATEETYLRLSLNMSTTSAGTIFSDMFDMTFNGETIETEGRTGTSDSGSGWNVYVDGTVAYVRAQQGKNTFMLVHKATNAGDNIRYLTISYANGEITAVQAVKSES